MHKKLEAELVSLAHSILQEKNIEDVNVLHEKARHIYEKLSVLKFVNANINEALIAVEAEDEVFSEAKNVEVENTMKVVPETVTIEETVDVVKEVTEEIVVEKVKETIEEVDEEISNVTETEKTNSEETAIEDKEVLTEAQVEAIFGNADEPIKDDVRDLQSTLFSLEDEFKDAISADVATDLFTKATKENPVVEEPKEPVAPKARSLNDTIFSSNLQVGLNDRIAFVKHLFEGSQEDFNRVLSQLNSFKTEAEAKEFLQDFVKLDYDWSEKEEYEARFMTIIERKFL
ncbi:hypothetical protein ACFQ5N_13800 [Lutibacter holmesii]|uniref:Uncharacterized protein n=1 Tax=Lutibacter holmesii TaxID=1137985 RepID=A0ABW3WSH7_9FLAO